jgi:sensor histidine kinase YesM
VLLVLLVASLILYAQQRIRRQQAEAGRRQMQAEMAANEEKQRIEREKVLAELNALKAQMNPHFLFNVLNSIQDLFMTGNSRLANEQLGKFSDLTRSILDASGRQAISLQEELDMLRNYLDLESLRFDEQFQYQLQVAPGLDLHGIEIPPMLVQPYVENAIKHGLLHKTSNRRLDVLFSLENPQLLRVEVTDNGVGRQQAAYYRQLRQGGRHKSFATSATEKRLQLLNQGRLANIAVTYTDLQDEQGRATGTTVVVLIPIGQE